MDWYILARREGLKLNRFNLDYYYYFPTRIFSLLKTFTDGLESRDAFTLAIVYIINLLYFLGYLIFKCHRAQNVTYCVT